MICPKCNSENPDSAKFCMNCGAVANSDIDSKESTAPTEPAPMHENELPSFSNDQIIYIEEPPTLADEDFREQSDEISHQSPGSSQNQQTSNGTGTSQNTQNVSLDQYDDYDDDYDEQQAKAYAEDYDPDYFEDDISSENVSSPGKSRKKLIIVLCILIGVLIVATVACIIMLMPGSSGNSNSKNPNAASDLSEGSAISSIDTPPAKIAYSHGNTFISEEGYLYYYDFENGESILLSDTFIHPDNYNHYENKDIALSADGSRIYYLANITTHESGSAVSVSGELYYREFDNPDTEILIESNVSNFVLMNKPGFIVYNKSGELYEYDTKNDVSKFVSPITAMESVLFYTDTKYAYTDPEGSLYSKECGKTTAFVSDNVSHIYPFIDGSTFYYAINNDYKISLSDYVEIDVEFLEQPVSPTEPTAPEIWNYDSYDDYEAAYEEYETAYDDYETAYNAYLKEYDKYTEQDSLRNMKNEIDSADEYQIYSSAVYCYVGSSSKQLTPSGYINLAQNVGGVVVDTNYKIDKKIKLSEVVELNDVSSFIHSNCKQTLYVVKKGNLYSFTSDINPYLLNMSDDMSRIAYTANPEGAIDNQTFDLYTSSFNGKSASSPQFVTSGVVYTYFDRYNHLIFAKNSDKDDDMLDFYIDGVYACTAYRILDTDKDGNVYYTNYVTYDDDYVEYINIMLHSRGAGSDTEIARGKSGLTGVSDDGSLIYSFSDDTGWDFYLYSDGKNTKIGDNVTVNSGLWNLAECGVFSFIDDGDLCIVKNGKLKKIAENVLSIGWIYSDEGC